MRVRMDHKADAVYLNLMDRDIAETEEIADGIMADYDAEGRIVGIEILDADADALKHVSFDLPDKA